MMRSANPALNSNTFAALANTAEAGQVMTIQGAATKTLWLLGILIISASWTWRKALVQPESVKGWMIGGVVLGLVFAMATVFKKEWSPFTAPLYAIAEGLFLGALSAFFEVMYPGIVFQAVSLTMGTLLSLLIVYKMGLIPVTENFRLGVAAATGGIAVVYLVSMVLGFFSIQIPLIHEGGVVGIGFSMVVIVVAALNLVMDFDFIEEAAARRVPKYMEWFAAFGLLVTLIWLYMEFLRLLAKLKSRD